MDFLSIIELVIFLVKVSKIFSKFFLPIEGFFFRSFLIISGFDNYLSFFVPFLPSAFSKIPLRVAPDFVAPSPNLAINDFSSSI